MSRTGRLRPRHRPDRRNEPGETGETAPVSKTGRMLMDLLTPRERRGFYLLAA